MKVTGETITDEQIVDLAHDLETDSELWAVCGRALGRSPYDSPGVEGNRTAARERCAAAWNARHEVQP